MSLQTLKILRDHIATTVRDTQIATLIDADINLTLAEIHNAHPWSWLRRKQTFSTVASQEDYNLDEEVDRIFLLRQRTTPTRLRYVDDQIFYSVLPNVEDLSTGTPRYYRLWEQTGFATNLAAADTIYVSSSSASDGSAFTVRVVGRNSSGEEVTETLTLNGTTNVTSTTTFAASGLKQVSKSARTTGTISVRRTTGATLLSELAPDELSPRYKRLSLYPIPSAVITMYLEYYERLRLLVHDTDTPQLDYKWAWVVREGVLAKVWEYKQNEELQQAHLANFLRGLAMMVHQDTINLDYVPVLQGRPWGYPSSVIRYSDSLAGNFPQYAVWY